jgi:hypothetical protein
VDDLDFQDQLKFFHEEHAESLHAMATELRAAGVERVHYGLDFYNDEADLSDYAVIEYADGRIEERNQWYEVLDYKVLWSFGYTGAYTFDVDTERVFKDDQGGVISMVSRLLRSNAYHTPKRREQLEAQNAGRIRRKRLNAEKRERKQLTQKKEVQHG